ncbi:sensor histidine kinase [Tellurirhabdus bombi]|uniref:sensor histidine kinase n=1 Tax=Tellurirhabdus bombi TaxID=2907205 RepID=UPI001F2A507B|nr:histidine kinase [Tellurirhabdus bombi]
MSKRKTYWLCQIIGWTSLVMFEFGAYTLEYGFVQEYFFLALANILLGIILTHLYRLMIQRWNWVRLPLIQLIPRVLASVFVLSAIMTMVNLPIDHVLVPETLVHEPLIIMGYLLSWGKSILAWVLSYTVYLYTEQNRNAAIETILLKTSIRETEAKVLRSQLNPHFVFNALNSIRALVLENPSKAQQGITQLSNILRNSLLADRRKTVELREEIKTVEDYLELEKVRYEDRLNARLKVDPKTHYLQVPPMMLQTLVENAIKHGVQKAIGGGFVELTSWLEDNLLHIRIRNTGALGDTEASNGFGLKNTSQRLELLYGPEASFRIRQETPDVVCADVVMPMQSDSILKRTDTQKVTS